MPLTRTQIDKLGDRLRRADVPSDDDLRLLNEYREERRAVMDAVGAVLAETVGTVPARRLKTVNSIADKLRRETARLSQVQDIAGLRIVREMTRAAQDVVVERITDCFPDSKIFDRRALPSHGYRAVHVVVALEGHLAEIQVRTALQHTWASLVESFANAWGQQIKYGEGPFEPDLTVSTHSMSRREVIATLRSASDAIEDVEAAMSPGESDVVAYKIAQDELRGLLLGLMHALARVPL